MAIEIRKHFTYDDSLVEHDKWLDCATKEIRTILDKAVCATSLVDDTYVNLKVDVCIAPGSRLNLLSKWILRP